MKVQGSYVFDAPPEVVFTSIQDPEILAATMPGCDKLELTGENEYDGILNIRVGPVQGGECLAFHGLAGHDFLLALTARSASTIRCLPWQIQPLPRQHGPDVGAAACCSLPR